MHGDLPEYISSMLIELSVLLSVTYAGLTATKQADPMGNDTSTTTG